MTLHFKGLSLQCFRLPYGNFPHCSQPAFSLVCQHYPQGSAPKAEQLAVKHLLHSSALQNTLPSTSAAHLIAQLLLVKLLILLGLVLGKALD